MQEGFAAGADDYLRKPFSPRELSARVQAVLGETLMLEALGIAALVARRAQRDLSPRARLPAHHARAGGAAPRGARGAPPAARSRARGRRRRRAPGATTRRARVPRRGDRPLLAARGGRVARADRAVLRPTPRRTGPRSVPWATGAPGAGRPPPTGSAIWPAATRGLLSSSASATTTATSVPPRPAASAGCGYEEAARPLVLALVHRLGPRAIAFRAVLDHRAGGRCPNLRRLAHDEDDAIRASVRSS